MKALAVRVALAMPLLAATFALGWAAETGPITVDLKTFQFKAADPTLFGYDDGQSRLFYYTGGAGETTLKLPADGEYEVVISAACDPAQGERAKFKVSLGGQAVGEETLLTDDFAKDYKFTAKAKAGEQKLSIEFTNDAYKEGEYDRNFYVHGVTVKKK